MKTGTLIEKRERYQDNFMCWKERMVPFKFFLNEEKAKLFMNSLSEKDRTWGEFKATFSVEVEE